MIFSAQTRVEGRWSISSTMNGTADCPILTIDWKLLLDEITDLIIHDFMLHLFDIQILGVLSKHEEGDGAEPDVAVEALEVDYFVCGAAGDVAV